MNKSHSLRPNTLAFMGLCNEYCATVQNAHNAGEDDRMEFTDTMLRLLPRIYICASDLMAGHGEDCMLDEEVYIGNALDEDYYDSVRLEVENIFGEEDTYLEVFHQDMKYSDTPVAASVSEGIADLFQVFYNFLEAVRDTPDSVVAGAVATISEDFSNYWSAILCNLLRALNHIKYHD